MRKARRTGLEESEFRLDGPALALTMIILGFGISWLIVVAVLLLVNLDRTLFPGLPQ